MFCQDTGIIRPRLATALTKFTGVTPRFAADLLGKRPEVKQMEPWDEAKCETHMTKVVKMFEQAYTRRMVPMALYNECTNFLPKLTFSHDSIASPLDRKKCRTATVKFSKRWNFGKAHWKYGEY